MITLYDKDGHRNVFIDNLTSGSMVQANQSIIISGGEALLLDPGGHKVYTPLFAELSSLFPINNLKYIFCSHQDPDIVAAMNGWLMMTEARAMISALWLRFVPHFGVDQLVVDRIDGIPDEGKLLNLGGTELKIIPAHFLHSSGNFHLYDPVSKILYTGDLGASLGADYSMVEDFEAHIQYMEGFHTRYLPTAKALKMWVNTVRTLDVEIIAPQHGAIFGNRELVGKFITWIEGLSCGLDLMGDSYPVP